MVIKKEQGDLFYRLWLPLLSFANYKYRIVKDFAADVPSKGISPEKASRVANRIWEDATASGKRSAIVSDIPLKNVICTTYATI